ncbi:hypothetical protein LWI28_026073 [Acer negundo]|uniref:PGG domain-containing protein n=1 Tax=Acer negundo TaxID=4023 RepID=A0AAD5IG93_ACENE|nr:hypothetical protein LWI28_026073 [Acer negundo]
MIKVKNWKEDKEMTMVGFMIDGCGFDMVLGGEGDDNGNYKIEVVADKSSFIVSVEEDKSPVELQWLEKQLGLKMEDSHSCLNSFPDLEKDSNKTEKDGLKVSTGPGQLSINFGPNQGPSNKSEDKKVNPFVGSDIRSERPIYVGPGSEKQLDLQPSAQCQIIGEEMTGLQSIFVEECKNSKTRSGHGNEECLNYYRPLYNAAQRGDWEGAKSFFERDRNALTATITTIGAQTVLHVAAFCCQWGFLLMLLELVSSPESIEMRDEIGNTVLHCVVQGGSLKTVKALVQKNANLLQMVNNDGELPLFYSIYSENKELVWYLVLITKAESPSFPFFIPSLPNILRTLIQSGYHAPSIKIVRDAKMKHECAVELVNHVVNELSKLSFHQIDQFLQNPTPILGFAIVVGIEEIVWTLLRHFPDLIYFKLTLQRNILQAAIEYRQENIVNIIKEICPTTTKNLCTVNMESDTTLHLAGKLAPASKLFSISGAALQMQRELQWFKEVEKITFPFHRERRNMNKETAKDVFRSAHEKLALEGEKWMKDTANSCMLVSTLIATVLFAAAFTVPGGNVNDKGIPIFLRTNAFTIFAISDALGLFSSLTSLLMFLAILTARYAIEDFLESLPKKLIIGLGSLFVAIAAMIIAFGATLTIVLSERWLWVSLPITLVASFPVAIFVMLQLPLFIQMIQSTYGASIFRPWPSRV